MALRRDAVDSYLELLETPAVPDQVKFRNYALVFSVVVVVAIPAMMLLLSSLSLLLLYIAVSVVGDVGFYCSPSPYPSPLTLGLRPPNGNHYPISNPTQTRKCNPISNTADASDGVGSRRVRLPRLLSTGPPRGFHQALRRGLRPVVPGSQHLRLRGDGAHEALGAIRVRPRGGGVMQTEYMKFFFLWIPDSRPSLWFPPGRRLCSPSPKEGCRTASAFSRSCLSLSCRYVS